MAWSDLVFGVSGQDWAQERELGGDDSCLVSSRWWLRVVLVEIKGSRQIQEICLLSSLFKT